ncbi:MAG: MBL fold metallo-hydrolase [Acidobacteria bacterium]|nr:MBL fold metallo-hydrolase [Acidobacteriota bacterium]
MRDRHTGVKLLAAVVSLIIISGYSTFSQQSVPAAPRTQVVLLGTGTPRPDPQRSGPATAIVVNGTPYLIDVGPGVVRRARAADERGIKGLAVTNLRTVFITHLHSDHTVGYPDLIFTTWVQGRKGPLQVYGPAGLQTMTKYILLAWQADIDTRTRGLEQRSAAGVVVEAHDVKPGVVYQDANVKVTAFATNHAMESYGYRFDASDRTVVISGDTNPSQGVIDNCRQCDVLIHEAYSEDHRPANVPDWLEYRSKYHTTTTQLAEIANKTQPKLLVVYHWGGGAAGRPISEEQYLAEIQRTYRGKVVIGHDLDVY